jgi:hypothetical protein
MNSKYTRMATISTIHNHPGFKDGRMNHVIGKEFVFILKNYCRKPNGTDCHRNSKSYKESVTVNLFIFSCWNIPVVIFAQ